MNVLYWRQKEHKDTHKFLEEIRSLYYKKTGLSASFLHCAREVASNLPITGLTVIAARVNPSAFILSTEGETSGST